MIWVEKTVFHNHTCIALRAREVAYSDVGEAGMGCSELWKNTIFFRNTLYVGSRGRCRQRAWVHPIFEIYSLIYSQNLTKFRPLVNDTSNDYDKTL